MVYNHLVGCTVKLRTVTMKNNNYWPNHHTVRTPTCHSISSYSIPFHLTALLPLSVPQPTHTNLVDSLTITANHFLTPSFSVYFHKQRKRAPASVLHPTSLAYQLRQPANGWEHWTAGDRNKRSTFGSRLVHSERSNCIQHIEKDYIKTGDTMPDCPAMTPRGPGTPPLIRDNQQQPVSTSRSRFNPTTDLRPINRMTSGPSSPAAYLGPTLHNTYLQTGTTKPLT